jgi:hypothetical protein
MSRKKDVVIVVTRKILLFFVVVMRIDVNIISSSRNMRRIILKGMTLCVTCVLTLF